MSVAIKVASHVYVVIAMCDGESCSMRHMVTCVCSGLLLPRDSHVDQAKLSCWGPYKSCNLVSRNQRLQHSFNFDGLMCQALSLPSKAVMRVGDHASRAILYHEISAYNTQLQFRWTHASDVFSPPDVSILSAADLPIDHTHTLGVVISLRLRMLESDAAVI